MVLDVKSETILDETDLEALEFGLLQHAKELTILGEVDTARELISLLEPYTTLCTSRNVLPLSWAWKETGKWPRGAPEESKFDNVFADLRKTWEESEWGQGYPGVPKEYQTFDQQGLEACLAIPERALKEGNLDTSTGWLAMEKSIRLTKALDISIRLAEPGERVGKTEDSPVQKRTKGEDGNAVEDKKEFGDDDEWVQLPALHSRSSEILNMIVARWNANHQVEYLSMAERLYPLFISGVVADTMGVGRKELQEKAARILHAYTERFANAFAPTPMAGKSMREILTIASENSLTGPGLQYLEEIDEVDDKPETLFQDPASQETIASLEERLAITLPDDYKEFLKITNGFGSFDLADGIFNGYCPDPALYTAENVVWKSEDNLPTNLLQIPREIEDLGDVQAKGWYEYETALPMLDGVLEIGARDIENLWLIRPELVQEAREAYQKIYKRADPKQKRLVDRAIEAFAGSREAYNRLGWCCAKSTSGGAPEMTFYSSFRRYLEIVTTNSMESKMDSEEDEQSS